FLSRTALCIRATCPTRRSSDLRIYKIGGAQAIAALAYGTETIPKVDKIVGPGNAFVARAKKWVFGDVAIDMIAGPSEKAFPGPRSEEHTSELQSRFDLVCRLLL